MKLITLFLIIATALPSHDAGAQVATRTPYATVEWGLNYSTLPGLGQHSYIPGFSLGFGFIFRLGDKWTLAPEILVFSNRGAGNVTSITNDVQLANPYSDIRTNYIDLPILIQYKISEVLSIGAGPQLGFLSYAYQSTTGNSLSTGNLVTVSSDIRSLMHKESFMVPVQLAYHFSRGKRVLVLKARYDIGVMESFTATSIASSKNSTFHLIFSIPFVSLRKRATNTLNP